MSESAPPVTGARAERAALSDLLAELGPDRPTRCEGWSTRDLAAHLVARERRPLSTPGLVLRRFAGYTERVRARLARAPYPRLVALVRRPPRWSPVRLRALDEVVNALELFIHHEDVRRARPDWRPRPLAPAAARVLWRRLRPLARLRLRRFPAEVRVTAPDVATVVTGAGGPEVTVTGDPGELALFFTGRQAAALVTLTGPDHLTERLRTASLAL